MSKLRHYPLGKPLSENPHVITSSLPTMADVRGYEERDSRVLSALQQGYPRFVTHPYVLQLIDFFIKREQLEDQFAMLIMGSNMGKDLMRCIGQEACLITVGNELELVHCAASNSELVQAIKRYVQHVGCGISSRYAEDLLIQYGERPEAYAEELFEGNAPVDVTEQLGRLYGCDPADVRVCASGMSAFYSGFRAIQAVQRPLGRTHWLQLGWLYLDSGCVLKTFLNNEETLEYCYDVNDTGALIEKIASLSETLAAVVVECPTNPLVQICDLERVSRAVRASGGVFMVDPTVASLFNVNVLPYADIVVNSLTKYAAYEGDVMSGSLGLNAQSPHYESLSVRITELHVSPYIMDLRRLAFQLKDAEEVVAQMNKNASRLAEFLNRHPAVATVHRAAASPHYGQVARDASCCGAMISIELKTSMELFYDAIALFKGPSFGTSTTLLSPFMYLAHYDLVTNAKGRKFLNEIGISPELIRISVGIEPYAEIEATFAKALERCCAKF